MGLRERLEGFKIALSTAVCASKVPLRTPPVLADLTEFPMRPPLRDIAAGGRLDEIVAIDTQLARRIL